MSRYPKFETARLSIFDNININKVPTSTGVIPPLDDTFETIMETPNRVVAKFTMPKEKPANGLLSLNTKTGNHRAYARVWLKFEEAKTIPISLNLVIKASAKAIENVTKYDISKEYNKKLRRSHTVWVAKTMKVGEFVSSYHSCLIDIETKLPIGFISVAKRDNQLVTFITQNYNGKVKHIIFTPNFMSSGSIVNGSFTHNSYRDMMKIIRDIEDDPEQRIEVK